LFADDIHIFRTATSATACVLLQTDIDSILGWCAVNSMILNCDKARVVTFKRTTNRVNNNYKLSDESISRIDCIKDLGVHSGFKLLFHNHADFIFPKSLKILRVIHTFTYHFLPQTVYCYYMLPKLDLY
jgi:hypothetical protein